MMLLIPAIEIFSMGNALDGECVRMGCCRGRLGEYYERGKFMKEAEEEMEQQVVP